ncbi:MAG: sigma-70 family RNA polymerase sigma factor [Anaerolineae bacterium]|nr:sigma-70 family RNA polymerase sigma factor [Anaerolineae bacterium]
MDEPALIEQARRGDVAAFNTLVLHYQDAAYNVAYRIMGDHDAAADATQEAFISAYRALKRFRGESLKPWLMRIVTNACYDELRRRQRRPTTSLEALHVVNPDPLVSLPENPESAAQRADLSRAIAACLDRLPVDQRVVVVFSDIEGYSYQEIAEIADVSLGTVKSRLSRARARLRDCLRGVKELLPEAYRLNSSEHDP